MAGTTEVATKLAEEYDITISSAKTMIVTVLDTIAEMAKEDRVRVGNHIFKTVTRAARKGRNPKTGEELMIPAKNRITYKYTGGKMTEPVAPSTKSKAKPKAEAKPPAKPPAKKGKK